MIPIDIQVSGSMSKVKPILYILEKGALMFYKHLYFYKDCSRLEAIIRNISIKVKSQKFPSM